MSLIKKILLKFKFRNLSFKYEGDNCIYRYLNSEFSYVENITIGNNVHLGPGCELDGAGSIVSKDIPDYADAVGNPAKVVNYRDSSVFDNLFNKKDSFVNDVFGHAKEFIKKNKVEK